MESNKVAILPCLDDLKAGIPLSGLLVSSSNRDFQNVQSQAQQYSSNSIFRISLHHIQTAISSTPSYLNLFLEHSLYSALIFSSATLHHTHTYLYIYSQPSYSTCLRHCTKDTRSLFETWQGPFAASRTWSVESSLLKPTSLQQYIDPRQRVSCRIRRAPLI